MATLLVKNVLDGGALDLKDRHARKIADLITNVAEAAGDKDSAVEVIAGQIFIRTSVTKALEAVKDLFKDVEDAETKELSDVSAASLQSRLSHDAKRAQEAKEAVKLQQ